MKTPLLQTRWTFFAGALLAFPAAYFVSSAILNYGLGIDWFWKPIEPIFDNPDNKHFGWNINMLIIFGPIIAVLINALSLAYFRFEKLDDFFKIEIYVKRNWLNIAVLVIAGITLASIFVYQFFENLETAKTVSILQVSSISHFHTS
ncbi:hypothetical protein BH10BAC3_BH10BAC3_08630 [soil metagenome]